MRRRSILGVAVARMLFFVFVGTLATAKDPLNTSEIPRTMEAALAGADAGTACVCDL